MPRAALYLLSYGPFYKKNKKIWTESKYPAPDLPNGIESLANQLPTNRPENYPERGQRIIFWTV